VVILGPRRGKPKPPPPPQMLELALPDAGLGRVELARGGVGMRPDGRKRWSAAMPGRAIEAGETLRTSSDPSSCARLVLNDGSLVAINSSSVVRLLEKGRVELQAGDAHFKVPKGAPLTVAAPMCSIAVRGTEFDVTVVPGRTTVSVSESSVELSARGKVTEIGPNTAFSVTEAGISQASSQGPAPWLAKLEGAPERETLGRLVARLEGKEVPLSVKAHEVRVTIRDQIAYTLIDEEFENHTGGRLEGTFYYPLPAEASLSRFAMYVDGKLMEGEVVERQRAREVYESILRQRRDPALLEWTAGNEFKARVFPIEPHSTKRVLLGYTQVLPIENGLVRYTYPLKSEKLTKNPLAHLRIELDAYSTPPITEFACPTHNCDVAADEHRGHAFFEVRDYTPTRDFIVSYRVLGPKAELCAAAHWRDDDGGYFLAFISPWSAVGGASAPRESGEEGAPSDVLLMLDTSASMAGDDFALARRLVAAYLNFLGDKDRFNVLLYDLKPRLLFPEFVENTAENRLKVSEELDKVDPFGASGLAAAIEAAGRACIPARGLPPPADSPRASMHALRLVYIGDGVATIGATEPAELLAAARAAFAGKSIQVSTLAIGSRYDRAFIEGFARAFGGVADYASPSRPVAETVAELVNDGYKPTVSDLKLSFEGVEVGEVYPRELPNVRVGRQIIVTGRYDKPGRGKMVVAGACGGSPYRREIELDLPGKKGPNTFIPHLWARRAMDDLLYRIGRGEKQLASQVIDLSLRYRLVSPYTSFLVLETEDDYRRFGLDRRFVIEQWTGPKPERQQALASDSGYSSTGTADALKEGEPWEAPRLRRDDHEDSESGRFGLFESKGDEDEDQDSASPMPSLIPSMPDRGRGSDTMAQDFFGTDEGEDVPERTYGFGADDPYPAQEPTPTGLSYGGGSMAAEFFGGEPKRKERWSGGPAPGGEGMATESSGEGFFQEDEDWDADTLYPPAAPQRQGREPKAPKLAPEVRKVVEAIAQGPADFRLHYTQTDYGDDGKPTSKTQATVVVLGNRFIRDERKEGQPQKLLISDGEWVHDCHERQSYAAARKAIPRDLWEAQWLLPGFTGYTPDRFLRYIAEVPRVESREGEAVILTTESEDGLTGDRYFVDMATRSLTKVERYVAAPDGEKGELAEYEVFDQPKTAGGRTIPTRVRQFDASGKLVWERAYDILEVGKVAGDFAFAPPEHYLVATYPLPDVAEAKKALDGAKRPERAALVLAMALEQAGRFREAAEAMAKVVQARPKDPYPLLYQAWLAHRGGDRGALPKAAETAIGLAKQRAANPEAAARNLRSLYRTILVLMKSAELHAEADKYLTLLFEATPKGSAERLEAADTLANSLGDRAKAADLWRRVMEEYATNGHAWGLYADFLRRDPERSTEAEAAYLKARELGESVTWSLWSFYQERGETEKGLAEWRRSFEKGLSAWTFRDSLKTLAQDMGPEIAAKEGEAVVAAAKDPGARGQALLGYLQAQREWGGWPTDPTALCQRLHEAYPDNPEVLQELLNSRNWHASGYDPLPALEKLLSREPQNAEEAVQRAKLLRTVAGADRGAVAPAQVARLLALVKAGKLQMTANEQAECLSELALAQEGFGPAAAVETYRLILALPLHPGSQRLRDARSGILSKAWEAGDFDGARKAFAEIARSAPDYSDLEETRKELADALRDENRLDELVAFCAEVVKLVPDLEMKARMDAARALAEQEKVSDACGELWAALEAAERSLRQDETDPDALRVFYRAGTKLIRLTGRDAALKAKYDPAIAARARQEKPGKEPRWVSVHLDLLRQRGKFAELIAELERLAARDPDSPLWPRHLAGVYAATRRYDKAAAIHEKLAAKNPKDPAPLIELSRLAAATGQKAKADEYWNAWLKAVPEDEEFLNWLGGWLAEHGETERAIAAYEKLLGFTDQPGTCLERLTEAYEKVGRKLDAAKAVLQAMRPGRDWMRLGRENRERLWPLVTEEAVFNQMVPEVERQLAASEGARRTELMALLAELHYHAGKGEKAAAWGEKALANAIELEEATFNGVLGVIRMARPVEQVVALLQEATKKAGGHVPSWLVKKHASMLFEAKRPVEGEKVLRAAMASASAADKADLALVLAEEIAQTEPTRAIEVLDEAAKSAPTPARTRVLHKKADLMASARKPPEQVVAAYRAALAAGPPEERIAAARDLAFYAQQTKQHEAAIEACKALCCLDRQTSPEGRIETLGRYLLENKLEGRAEAVLRECVRCVGISAFRAEAWRAFGRVFASKGQLARAVRIRAEGFIEMRRYRENSPSTVSLLDDILLTALREDERAKTDLEAVRGVILEELDWHLQERWLSQRNWPEHYWQAVGRLGLADALVARLKAVPENQPGLAQAYQTIAELFRQRFSDDVAALKYYRMALKFASRPDREGLVDALVALHEAREEWQKAYDVLMEQRESFRTRGDHFFGTPEGHYATWAETNARLLAKLGKRDDALKAYQEASKALGKRDYTERRGLAQGALDNGFYDFAIEEMRLALRAYEAARRRGEASVDDIVECYRSLAKAYQAKGEEQKAVDELLTGLTRVPEDSRGELTRDLMDIYERSGKLDALVADYEREAAATRVEKPMLRVVFGDLYRQKEALDQALKQYRAALEVAPHYSHVRQRVVEILKEQKRPAELIEAYRQWVRAEPKRLDAYKELGRLLREDGRDEEAMRAYTAMLDALPTEAESHREMARIFADFDFGAELAMWKKVVQFRPEEPENHYALAASYVKCDQPKEAERVYRAMLGRKWDERFGNVRSEATRRLEDLTKREP